jgi:pyruvate/2-oxoglutarate dehydrogenase complex dihydrolipoamide acyltransferase (E2) component
VSISGVGGVGTAGYTFPTYNTGAQNSASTQASAQQTSAPTSTGNGAASDFLSYMKESIGQRMIDNWLSAHHLTQKDLDAMDPKQREAIMRQMKDDIQKQLQQQTEAKTKTDILV